MNQINLKYLITIVSGLLGALFVMTELMDARTGIGKLYLYFAIASFFIGLSSPKRAMYIVAFCTIYIDVFKRMMVIGGNPTFVEVSYVMAIPPLLVGGSLLSIFLSLIFSRNRMSSDMVIALVVASLIAFGSMVGILLSNDQSGLSTLGSMVNQGFYAYLVFMIPVIFTDNEQRRKYLHFIFVLLIPSVFYMFWQEYHGYADFEQAYLDTGLTIEAKNLTESAYGELRKFSTLNGCGTASTIYSTFALMCFVSLKPNNEPAQLIPKVGKWMLFPCFALAAYYTISRTGWFCGLGAIFTYFMLGSRTRAYFAITSSVSIFLTIVLLAPMAIEGGWLGILESKLRYIVMNFTDDPGAQRAIVLGTVGDRIQGWANLTTEPKLWTPFGFAAAGFDGRSFKGGGFRWGHDALIDTLIRFGYVPLSLILFFGSYMLYCLFRYMYSLPKTYLSFKMTRLCLALNAGFMVGGMGSTAQFRNFPQNFFFMLYIAIPFAIYQQAMRERKQANKRVMLESPQVPRYADLLTGSQRT